MRPALFVVGIALLSLMSPVALAFEPAPEGESLKKAHTGKSFSPYASRNFPSNVYWGDTHLHTTLSFDPKERAFYYTRVIEIPTPRWTLYDAVRLGADVPDEAPKTTQERAYTSPIWYTPKG